MLNANDTQLILEKWYADNVNFWLKDKQSPALDEREAHIRALEWDLIPLYKLNGRNRLHDYNSPKGDELNTQTVLDFFKYRCMDIYGKDWEEHYNGYEIKQNQ